MSRRQIVVRAAAEFDISKAALWYHAQKPGLGDEFEAEVQATFERAAARPRQYWRLRRHPEIRQVLTWRFPYCVYYVVRPDSIIVFRVLHAARDDRQWKKSV
jgi:toxin ParE1/3/4